MSLLVWLPLNGNLENKGITSINTTNTPVYMDGKMGKAISLTSRVTFSGLPKLSNFTIAFWAKVESCTMSWADLLGFTCKQADDSSAATFRFEATTSSRACSFHNNAPEGISTASRILIQNYNEWHHVAVSYNGGKLYSYIDGKLTYTDTGLGGYLTSSFWIGESPITGAMNDLRIYDECLSVKQIKEISKGLILHYPLNSGYGNENLMRMGGLDKNGATSMTYDSSTDTYTIESPVGTSSWGYGVSIKSTSEISIPYGKSYRASVEIYVPTEHSFVVDINNNVASGTAWAGNDNDNTSKRTSTGFTVPANTWKKISWGSENSNGNNTDKVAILPYDKLGLKTNSDTDSVTWYLRHPKIEIGTNVTDWCPNKNNTLYTTLGYNDNIEYDTSGFGNNGTKNNNPTSMGNGVVGNSCLNFNGSNQYISVGRGAMVKDAITINIWAYMENWSNFGGSTGMRLISCTESGGWNFEPMNGYLNFAVGVGTTTNGYTANFSSQIKLADMSSGWHMITGTFDGINKKIYLDGTLKGTISLTEKTPIFYNSTNGIFIAAEAAGNTITPAGNYFNGNLNDIRIYSTALSAEDIKQLYESKARIDKDGNLYSNQFIEIDNERNLLDTDQYWISGTTTGSYTQEKVECSDSSTGFATKITCMEAGSGFYMSGHKVFNKTDLIHGKQYVVSLYAKSDNRTTINLNVECASQQSKGQFTIGNTYRRLFKVFTYSNTTQWTAFTSYSNWQVDENLYIHSIKVTEYNPEFHFKNNGTTSVNNFIEINSEQKTKIYKQDIQVNEIIEI